MKKHFLIFVIVFSIGAKSLFSQENLIKIQSKDSTHNTILKKIVITKNDSKSSILKKLQKEGYFYSHIDSIKTLLDHKKIFHITLGPKIDSLNIRLPIKYEYLKKELPILEKPPLKIKFTTLSFITTEIQNYFSKKGKPFTSIRLRNISLVKKSIYADLDIQESKQRTVDKIVIQGYNNFPKSYLKHFLRIKKGISFNKEQINSSAKNINNLEFAQIIKPPEALFNKDSTTLYLYIKKLNRNNFDGLLNFSTNPTNQELLITGNLNLDFMNLLNTGEELKLEWNANGNQSQNINLQTKIPFIFNSPISNNTQFSIHKQDSTFLNSTFNTTFNYFLNPKTKIEINYEATNSSNTLTNTIENLSDYTNNFGGIGLSYNTPKNHEIFRTKFLMLIQYQFGKRTTDIFNDSQHRFKFESSYIFDINNKNSIFLANQTNLLFSNNLLTNELFRIGGPDTVRGINQQSLFTHQYSFLNLEYRIQTASKSYLYSITDVGIARTIDKQYRNILSLGAGYSFFINKSKIDVVFSGSLNNTLNSNNVFNTSLSFKNYF
ncbi:hypothetical protein BTO06_11435 [Tenacibaculum sp. SZ-18]|uniref:POTRA domain-containing protein n=1 Tax=Tenacibaculum sp. SZ-18 TaxID=754423 RepID=UPI000C2CF88D|nr:POTRA domain-containing protein [Tenacibaculum sp. SZ-18]AUC15723.1 hypothetical protein BTO06_11435 [Tenacibaculum sp. SZ-18]